MTTDYEIEGVRWLLRLVAFTVKPGLRRACYRGVGEHLRRLREGRERAQWLALAREAGLSPRRAYELLAPARGGKPLSKLRAEKAMRERKRRKAASDLRRKRLAGEAPIWPKGSKKRRPKSSR